MIFSRNIKFERYVQEFGPLKQVKVFWFVIVTWKFLGIPIISWRKRVPEPQDMSE